ncbi:hypothetical protein GCM10023238_34350 [Streptomyces heliomycini]
MEGEDPVAVLSDLELLSSGSPNPPGRPPPCLGYCEPRAAPDHAGRRRHSPPLLLGERRTEFVETVGLRPLGMLACWEAPSVEVQAEPGERRSCSTRRRAAAPHRATRPTAAFAQAARRRRRGAEGLRRDPGAVADHVLRIGAARGRGHGGSGEDVVLLAARFE